MMSDSSHNSLDQTARQLHRAALDNVSAATLSRLRLARQGAAQRAPLRRRAAWPLATACSAVLAVAAAWHFSQPSPMDIPATLPSEAALAADQALSFDDSPELYLWLGSDTALALE